MKRVEYVRATNVVKLQIALDVLRDVFMDNTKDAQRLSQVQETIYGFILKYELNDPQT